MMRDAGASTIERTPKGIEAWLIAEIAERRGIDPRAIDRRERFSRYGLDSMGATSLLARLGEMLGRSLPATLAWEYPTVEALARYLIEGASAPTTRVTSPPAPRTDKEPIAVIGIACRFPKAPSPEAFWRLLCDGVDAITQVPDDRWDAEAFYDADPGAPGKMNTRWGGFIAQIDSFDPQFFGISPREAAQMDPQQRLMLELSWEALEDAGAAPQGLKGSRTGVFFGSMWSDYTKVPGNGIDAIVQHTATAQDSSIIPARVSYTLGLQGPSVAVNTACSSSLVAVHLACQSLRDGESRVALAGGVNLIVAPESTVAMSKFGAMAPDGRSKAFDARANGYVRGEGAGVVVLKPLSRALLDGDPIYCVIRGSAVNNDGFSNGLTAPNPKAQEEVLRDAYARAGVAPKEVQFVETHGTGTILGDPIEARALGAALSVDRPEEQPLRLGSVKTNIGHLEAAAGIAGLIKAALAIKHRAIPPNLHFQTPNPHIPFEELRLKVPRSLEPWPAGDGGRALAGVSSFGFGGTNCHVVLEGAPSSSVHLLPLSADSAEALKARVQELKAALAAPGPRPSLEDLCAAAAARRHEDHRLALTLRGHEDLAAHLDNVLEGRLGPGIASGHVPGRPPRLVFVFTGHGSQWIGMGRDLMREEPAFRAALERCDQAMRPHVDWSLLDVLRAGEAPLFERSDIVQPAIFAVQVALAALWRSWGVEPDAVVGQSMGEVAAAHVAGALTLEDAARVICLRSQLVTRVRGQGGMAVVELSLEQAERALAGYAESLSVAVSTSPRSTVISGDTAALEEVLAKLHADGIFCRPVRVDYASHSLQMDALKPELLRALEGLRPRPAAVPFYSTVTGSVLSGVELDAGYWVRNLREPVLFAGAVQRLLEEGHGIFLDINPHPLVTHAIEQSLEHAGREGIVVPSLRRDEAGRAVLLDALGVLYTRGRSVDWRRLAPLGRRGAQAPSWPGSSPSEQGAIAPHDEANKVQAELLPLSAHTKEALAELARSVASWMTERGELSLQDLCYTAGVRRSHHEHRLAVVGQTRQAMIEALSAFGWGESPSGIAAGKAAPGARPEVVFVFPGQGSQWAGMGRELLAQEPVFRASVAACDALVKRFAGWSLLEELAAPEATSRLGETVVAQPALFAVQVGVCEVLKAWGVTPDAVVGHSVGEIAAAHVAGALSLEEAVRLVCCRGQVMQQATGLGKMAVVAVSAEEAAQALRGYEDRLAIAAINDPGSVVLSGEPGALAEVVERLQQRGVHGRMLRVDYAFHSPQMAPFQEELTRALGRLSVSRAEVAMYSSVTGARIEGEALDTGYWARNLREPVQLARAVQAAIGDGHRLFVEVGPHPVLTANVQECLRASASEGHALPTLRRGQEERRSLLLALGELYAHGYAVAWELLHPHGGRVVPLPTYPWQRQRYWIEPSTARSFRDASGVPDTSSAALLSLLGEGVDEAAVTAQLGVPAGLSAEEMSGVRRVLAALRGQAQQARAGAAARAWLYRPEWRQSPLSVPPKADAAGHWVVLVDDAGVGERLADALEAAGGRCARVRQGTSFERTGSSTWSVDPASAPGLEAWWSERLGEWGPVRGVVSLWSLGEASTDASVMGALHLGVLRALTWVQTLVKTPRGPLPKLWLVTQGAVSVGPKDALVAPEQAPLWGLGRVVALEHVEVWGGLIDLPSEQPTERIPALVEQVLAFDGEDQVALRPSGRYVQRLVRHTAAPASAVPWSARGTVLITGGLGAVGLRVARWLAAQGASHLVLTSRRGMATPGAAEAVASLEALGAAVTVAPADAADAAAMAAIIADIDARLPRLPPLTGVVHAAGVLDDGVLMQQDANRFAAVLAPKVLGASTLHALTRRRSLDFFVLFSSVASVLGSPGQGNYAAANAFLDALAHARRAMGLVAHSVNWGPWRDGGMATARVQQVLDRRGIHALAPDVAVEALSQVLRGSAEQVVVADVDWSRLRVSHELSGPRPLFAEMPLAAQAAPRPMAAAFVDELKAAPLAARSRMLSRWVQRAVAETLGFRDAERLDLTRGFFDQGMDSLLAVELRRRIHHGIGLSMTPAAVFNHPTVVALTELLLKELSLDAPRAAEQATAVLRDSGQEPIAIVGMGCRLPAGIATAEELWKALSEGLDAVTEVPHDRWEVDAYYDPDPEATGKMYARQGAFLAARPDGFDAQFFGIAPREAEQMDPQHRLLLEVTWEALEQAGVVPGSDLLTGIFVGIGASDYSHLQRASGSPERLDPYTVTGTGASFSAGRLSYVLGLQGPSLAVDTACSSSLVAIHLACQSLRAGECRVAVAGGVQLMLSPTLHVHLSRLRALSPDGRCKSFSAEADGYGRGEGCGMLVLKRLSDAQRDGDRILALIRGSAVNHDGHSSGLTVPNGLAQQAVLRQALGSARLDPADIDYVEAHGTGTALGDPIEVEALAAIYGAGRAAERPLLLGSVKTNIGHLESAAGVAGVMKVVLSLEHGELPPLLHARELNPHVRWAELPVAVTTTARAWASNGRPRRAGVSSFGMSGTNAHVVLEEAPGSGDKAPAQVVGSAIVLPLSARSPEALSALVQAYGDFLAREASGDLGDIAYTASVRRAHHEHRLAVVGRSRQELSEALQAHGRGEPPAGMAVGKVAAGTQPSVVFVFSGQGSQWAGMGRELLEQEPAFRAAIEACDALVKRHAGWSLLEELAAPEATSRLDQTTVAQPALFAMQVGLCEVLKSWGITPDAVVGHSVGEIAAAHMAGALSLEEAVRLVCCRGQVMQKATGLGKMAAIALSAEEAAEALRGYEDRLAIAAINDPGSVVLSGDSGALAEVVEGLQQRGVHCRMLRVDYAFHSPQMAPFQGELTSALGPIEQRRAERSMYSTVTGAKVEGEALDTGYWARNLREPVQLAGALEAAIRDGHCLFVEVGPHPVLTANAVECLRASDKEGHVLPTLRRGHEERRSLLQALGGLYAHGAAVEWTRLYPQGGRVVSLPAYPWQRERYWIEEHRAVRARAAVEGNAVAGQVYDSLNHLLGGSNELEEESWETYLTFGPLREIIPGFSWLDAQVMTGPQERTAHTRLILDAQREMREVLFRHVDFASCTKVLDFGCGYATDLMVLAKKHPHLELHGYTISAQQAEADAQRVRGAALGDRVKVYHRDSAEDAFPAMYDLVFGFEVAHHIRDKQGLFFNISRHLNEGGAVVLADFISNVQFEIEHEETSSFFLMKEQWIDVLSRNSLRVVDCVDTSQEIANYLHEPEFDSKLEAQKDKGLDHYTRSALKSYDQLGKLLRRGLASYVLMTARKDAAHTAEELARLNRRALEALIPYEAVSPRAAREPGEEWLHALQWRRKEPGAQAQASPGSPGAWLVLTDRGEVGSGLVSLLRGRGEICVRAVVGEPYGRIEEGLYRIDPADPRAFQELLHDAFGQDRPCRGVVHLWSLDATGAGDTSVESLEADQRAGSLSALFLAQALVQQGWREAPRVWLVTRGAQAVGSDPGDVSVAQAPLWGFGRTLALEHPELQCARVDLSPAPTAGEAAALLRELGSQDGEDQIALRCEGRYVARLARGSFAGASAARFAVQAEGTYLITGGLGGLGLSVARWLVEKGARHLALVGRSGASEEARAAIAAMEEAGARVAVVRADVSRRDQAAAMLVEIERGMPPLRGVVHAAGVLLDRTVLELTEARFRRVMAPKMLGAWNLHALTQDHALDFFVLYSSGASLLGSSGQANYAAGNAFMDALAHHRRASGLPAMSINWGAFSGVGMAAAQDNRGKRLAAQGMESLTPEQGTYVLGRLLDRPQAQVGVLNLNLGRLLEADPSAARSPLWAELLKERDPDRPKAPEDAGFLATLRSARPEEKIPLLERHLAEQLGRVLRLDASRIDRQAAFSSLGVDSLMSLELRNRLEASLRLKLAMAKFLQRRSIADFSEYVMEQLAAEGLMTAPEAVKEEEDWEVIRL